MGQKRNRKRKPNATTGRGQQPAQVKPFDELICTTGQRLDAEIKLHGLTYILRSATINSHGAAKARYVKAQTK